MLGFAQPTTYVVTIMKNFLTALASALLVAVIVTSLHYFVFSNDMDRAPLSLFVLSFFGMAAVALFNVRLSALRSGIAAPGSASGATSGAGAQPGRNQGDGSRSANKNAGRGAGRNGNRDSRNSSTSPAGQSNRGRGGNKNGGRGNTKEAGSTESKPGARPKDAAQAPSAATIPDGPRETGSVKWFNRSKGFGFIIRPNGEEIFVHHRSIRNSDESRRSNLRDGQEVNYVVADHSKGQQAEDVVGD